MSTQQAATTSTAAPTAAEQPVIVERRDGVGVVTFNNPARHNAMSLAMWQGAAEAIAGFADDDTVRCIVFTGAGNKAFVAGADISKFENERASVEHIEVYNRAVATYHRTVQGLMKPTIARIDGSCIGGGLAIALACDIRIASDDARFAVPAAQLGIGYHFDRARRPSALVAPQVVAADFST